MAIVFTEGFDNYGTATSTTIALKWREQLGLTPTSSVTPYGYGQSATWSNFSQLPNFNITGTNTVTVGVCMRINSLTPTAGTLAGRQNIYLNTSSAYTMGLQVNSDGSIGVNRMTDFAAGTVLGTSTAKPFTAGNFYYIEFSVTLSTTVGTIRVDVNGQTVINLTNQNTQNGASNLVNLVLFGNGGAASTTVYLDDIYVSDSITPLGPQRIETLRPNADTAQKQWTASTGTDNYAMVDESPMNTTDYVYTSTLNNYDLYDFGNLSATPSSISSVTAYALAQKDNVGTRAIAIPVKSSSTTNDGANFYLASGWLLTNRILETDPNTNSAWTGSAVNAIQAGLKVTI